jgi:hypothetical protein
MRKIDALFAVLGVAIASFLTWHAYYAGYHREVARINESVYLVFFPPSIGLMVTENATKAGQVFIVLIVVAANGVLYGLVCLVLRNVFGQREK